ncbi:MAG: polysaccharide deacetylase family protein [Clostridiales bacterium]|nr:polysaccharide deacetylase family protein [Clostridiales bacterium]
MTKKENSRNSMGNKRRGKSVITFLGLTLFICGAVFVAYTIIQHRNDKIENNEKQGDGTSQNGEYQSESDSSNNLQIEDPTSGESQGGVTSDNRVNVKDYVVTDEIKNLNRDIRGCGYDRGTAKDEFNRPIIIENLQSNYGDKYNALFIETEAHKNIYLTFTMGYEYYNGDVPNTEVVLKTLREKGVKAVFFVDGGYVRNNPEMCKKIVEEGHLIGCHGYDHPSEGVASYPIDMQIDDATKIYNAIYEVTGVEPYLYRFGSGIWSEQALALLDSMGFKNVFYSFTYYDFDTENQPSEDSSLELWLKYLHNGEIMYLHTVSNTSTRILGNFIDEARNRGYEFAQIQ